MRYIVVLFFIVVTVNAQNLIPNPSFEEHSDCPLNNGEISYAKGWTDSFHKLDSPDYFNSCCDNLKFGVPRNIPGYQMAKTGNAYAGIGCYIKDNDYFDHREFIQTKLITLLKKNIKYHAEFYVSLSNASTFSINEIGMHLSKKQIRLLEDKKMFQFQPQVINDRTKQLADTLNWMKISGDFVAEGGESYLMIGTFKKDADIRIETASKKLKGYGEGAYYLVDDVSIVEIKDSTYKEKTDPYFHAKINEPVQLKNIYFETAKSTLLPKSNTELDSLVLFLKNIPSVYAEIAGHTDNVGKEENNLKLSEARAKAVVDYLVLKGITLQRLNYKGCGSSQPIADNATEEGREKNRRVEFTIIKNEK